MVEDYQEIIWIGTENGLVQLDPIQNTLSCISKIKEGIDHIVVDEMNNKWIIGLRGTIYKINQDNTLETNPLFINNHLTTYQRVTSVFERNQKLWMGTSDGFNIYIDTLNRTIDTIRTPVKNTVHSIYVDDDNQIFIGTDKGMFYQKNPKEVWLSEDEMPSNLGASYGSNIPFSKLAINHLDEIEGIYKITSIGNDLWILGKSKDSAEFRLMSWRNNSWKHHHIDCMTTLPKDIRLDGDGNIWLNSVSEVIKYDSSTGKCKLIISQQESSLTGMVSNTVMDNRNRLWIGSRKKGLYSKELEGFKPSPAPTKPNVKKPEAPPTVSAENNLTFLLDVSHSMKVRKKQSVLEDAMIYLIKELNKNYKVSIVAYSGEADIILYPTSGDNNRAITNAVKNLPKPRGNTNMDEGVKLAYDVVKYSLLKEGNNKIILITDGQDIAEKSIKETINLIRSPKNTSIHLSILYFSEKENISITNKFKGLDKFENASFKYVRGDRLKKELLEEVERSD